MSSEQKKTFLILLILCAVTFIAFIFPNATGAEDLHMLFVLSTDEHITYPYLMNMIAPADSWIEELRHFIAYQDYHYGYPYYLLSALVIWPFRDIQGAFGLSQTQFHLLLLRQLINVLPMLGAILVLVYLQTRFKYRLRAIVLFLFLTSIMGVFRSQMNWWHPDSLAIFAVTLVFFFLERDRLAFGRNFFFAAAACGLAIGTKTMGFFFFLTIAGYLLGGLVQHAIHFKQAIIKGLLFIILMLAVVILTNPLLLHGATRERYLAIQSNSSHEMTHGWADEDTYETGISSWMPYLEKWYAQSAFLVFALLSLLAGCFWGPGQHVNRLILGWVIPYSVFLLFFVAIKPDHYWLPVMLPFFSSLITFTFFEYEGQPLLQIRKNQQAALFSRIVTILAVAVILGQFTLNCITDVRLYQSAMMQERLLELNIHD